MPKNWRWLWKIKRFNLLILIIFTLLIIFWMIWKYWSASAWKDGRLALKRVHGIYNYSQIILKWSFNGLKQINFISFRCFFLSINNFNCFFIFCWLLAIRCSRIFNHFLLVFQRSSRSFIFEIQEELLFAFNFISQFFKLLIFIFDNLISFVFKKLLHIQESTFLLIK